LSLITNIETSPQVLTSIVFLLIRRVVVLAALKAMQAVLDTVLVQVTSSTYM
jgi:hypothetical protein